MWKKTKLNKLLEQGIQWEWVPETGVPVPAIHKISLQTQFGNHKVFIHGTAAKTLLSKLELEINPIHFKGLPADIESMFGHNDMVIRINSILSKYGLEEI